MLQSSPTTFVTKLGATRAGPSSRIWIEGQRLIAAGFHVGMKFEKDFDAFHKTLYLTVITDEQLARNPLSEGGWDAQSVGTVSGKGGKPIIDIVGRKVIECFGCTHVNVVYQSRFITITPAGDQ